jgi:hypothetical protein
MLTDRAKPFDGIAEEEDLLHFYKKLPYQPGSSSFCPAQRIRFPGAPIVSSSGTS